MDWLNDLIGIGATAASGGLLGLLGNGVSQWFKMKHEKQRHEFKMQEWEREERLMALEMQRQRAEDEHELDLIAQQGSYTGMAASYEAEKNYGEVSLWANNFRALFRYFFAIAVWVLAALLFWRLTGDGVAVLSAAEQVEIVRYMVYTTFFTASTAAMWLYGDRASNPPWLKK